MMEERNYNIEKILSEIFCGWVVIFFVLTLFYQNDEYNFSALKPFISNETFWSILGINIDILTVISLVIALKKDYYLGIDVKSVMKLYNIPDFIIMVLICSCSAFLFYGIYNLKVIKGSGYSIFIELTIYTFILLILFNLIILIYTTINICINSSKKEMKTFKCLRYKIVYEYQLKQEESISNSAVEKISTFLVGEILKYYKKFNKKANKLEKVQYESVMILMKKNTDFAKKYNKKFRCGGAARVTFGVMLWEISLISTQWSQIREHFIFTAIAIVVTLLIIGIGAVTNKWNVVVANRSFWVFTYEDSKKEDIAAFGFNKKYSNGYEFIGAIEDLIGFYKILLYNQQGEMVKDIVIEKVKTKVNNESDEKIKNSLLLLLYYLDYEKSYLENENTINRKISGEDKEQKIREKIIKKLKQKNIYNCEEMKTWLENINQESVEYQLADSILKHVYKEPEINEDRTINPEQLRNYKFEYYFEFLKSKVTDNKKEYINNIKQVASDCLCIDKVVLCGFNPESNSDFDIIIFGEKKESKFLKSKEYEQFERKVNSFEKSQNCHMQYFKSGKKCKNKIIEEIKEGEVIYQRKRIE